MSDNPSTTYLPTKFWVEVMTFLDRKVQIISDDYGYGKIIMTVQIADNKVKDVIFNDEVRMRSLVEKAVGLEPPSLTKV